MGLCWVAQVRSMIASRFFVAMRRATHRMPSSLFAPTKSRVLVIAPHFDDEAISCGGTIALHVRAGSDVRVAFVSDSACPDLPPHIQASERTIRREEALRAKQILGYGEHTLLDFPDGYLAEHESTIAERLQKLIEEQRPDKIFCPFPADGHGDHQATALATGHAAVAAGFDGQILAYEVWTPMWPNICVDISDLAPLKRQAIEVYTSQAHDRDYAAAALGLNRYRGMRHSVEMAEGFFLTTPKEFSRLSAALNSLN